MDAMLARVDPHPIVAQPVLRPCPSASTDDELIEIWIRRQRSPKTRLAYAREAGRFRSFTGKPIQAVGLRDLLDYAEFLSTVRPQRGKGQTLRRSSQGRALSIVRSMFSFALRIGFVTVNPAALVHVPKPEGSLNERILSEEEVMRLVLASRPGRNRNLLRTLYIAALRVAEVCRLRWSDLAVNREAGQATVLGKGAKIRTVRLSRKLFDDLIGMRGDALDSDPVFRSTKTGGHLDPSAIFRVVRAAARKAGINRPVSPHWFRHSSASHAVERGCPIATVRDSLGHASIATTSTYLHARPDTGAADYLIIE